MERYTRRIYIRATATDYARAKLLAEETGLSISDLIRLLLQLPSNDVSSEHVIVLDLATANKLYRELNHWGYQRNQAVHALNRIAYYLERNSMDTDDVIDALSRAKAALDAVNRATAPLASDVRTVAESRILFR
jgi:antitoxin component of RelBE/YafQ-DinJ toxin-antitoxin module